jgi:uncharacterized membrane protein
LVFDTFMGVPVHPLLVHAAVVFVPLLCLTALAYALVPRVRGGVGWLAGLLAIATPFTTWFATLSGNKLHERLIKQGFSGEILNKIDQHSQYGNWTFRLSVVLGLVTLLLVALTGAGIRSRRIPSWLSVIFALAILGLSAATAYYVFKTGDSGAKAVWGT